MTKRHRTAKRSNSKRNKNRTINKKVAKLIESKTEVADEAVTLKHLLYEAITWLTKQRDILCKDPSAQFVRNRTFTAFTFIHYLLSQSAQALNGTLADYHKTNNINIPTKAAICQMKSKLSERAMPELYKKFNSLCQDNKTFRGYRLFAFDGTALNIARNPDSETYFQKGNYNQLLITALYDICNYTYLDVDIQPRPKQYEVRSAIGMLKEAKLPENTIILADRLYFTLNFIEHLNQKKVKYLIRCKSSHTLREIDKLPNAESDIWVSKELRTTQTAEDEKAFKAGEAFFIQKYSDHNKNQSSWDHADKCTLEFRLVKVKLDDKWEVLLTNLSADEFSAQDLKELYHLRWGIETSFRDLKYSVGLTNLHTKKEEYTKQEIYARLIVFNLAQRIIRSGILKRKKKEHQKWEYSINIKEGITAVRSYLHRITDFKTGLQRKISRLVEAVRPGRSDRRKEPDKKSFVPFIYRVA